jgi:3-deoxy-manno-octulosonate cytidylyltransferase (CMP-KDO synthetase)
MAFDSLPTSKLEKIEKLEQLRVLEAGYKIQTVVTDLETIGVDTQEDFDRVKVILEREGF